MSKCKLKLITVFLTIVYVFALYPAFNCFADTVAFGKCGDDLKWVLDDKGTLTISGSGEMYDYSDGRSPWRYQNVQDDIKTVVFSGNITRISFCSFYACENLTSITIPNSVWQIGRLAFSGCHSLSDVTIPNSVEYIGVGAFQYCHSLRSIEIPDSVTYIASGAFYNSALTSVSISDSVAEIYDSAFEACYGLTYVTLPRSLSTINKYTFCDCVNLKKVTIPSNVTEIYDTAFKNCDSLAEVCYLGTYEQWNKISVLTTDGSVKTLNDVFPNVAVTFMFEPQLSITSQPEDYSGLIGSTAEFKVNAKGDGLTYQWQYYKDGQWSNSNANGSKTNQLSVTVTQENDFRDYRCIIKDSNGKKITTKAVAIYVTNTLSITSQPKNYVGKAGSTAQFNVKAQGAGLKFCWQVYSNGEWKDSSAKGAKTSSISFTVTNEHNGKKYRCIVRDRNGNRVISDSASVKVLTPITISKQPSDYTGTVGSTASFTVAAQGTGLAYQWQVYSNGAWKNSNAASAKTSKLTFNVTENHNGMKYRCLIKDSNGQKVYTNTAAVHVSAVTITKQPANVTGAVGDTATFSVTAQGTGLQYQWQMYTNGAWKNSGATGAKTSKITFKIAQSHNGVKYRCIITNSKGQKFYSNTATVKVVPSLSITKQPASVTCSAGTTVAFSVTATGEGLTYQWQMYSNGAWKNSGATGATTSKISFKATKNHNGMKYRCIIVDNNGKSIVSNAVSITVK
ncbi:MAG: leucine-rich repeat protein [Clostridiales bacterium]|nr:leucine-rich repeat protein [Clostridiales bacterium]